MNPFAFEPLDSPLAGMTAVSKGFFLLCASAAAMRFSLAPLLVLAGAGIVLMTAMRIPARGMGKAGMAIAYLVLLAAIVKGLLPGDGRIFAPETLPSSALYAARLATVFIFARIFYVTTKASELGDYLSAAARRMAGFWRKIARDARRGAAREAGSSSSILSDPGMLLSLSMLFLPRVFDDYGKVKDAAEIRGLRIRRKRWAGVLAMLFTFIFAGVKRALRTAQAMELRGYTEARTIALKPFAAADAAALAAGASLAILASLGL